MLQCLALSYLVYQMKVTIYRRCLRSEMKVSVAVVVVAAVGVVRESRKVYFVAAKVEMEWAVSFRQISLDAWEERHVCPVVDGGDAVAAVVGIYVALKAAASGCHGGRFCVYFAAAIEGWGWCFSSAHQCEADGRWCSLSKALLLPLQHPGF